MPALRDFKSAGIIMEGHSTAGNNPVGLGLMKTAGWTMDEKNMPSFQGPKDSEN